MGRWVYLEKCSHLDALAAAQDGSAWLRPKMAQCTREGRTRLFLHGLSWQGLFQHLALGGVGPVLMERATLDSCRMPAQAPLSQTSLNHRLPAPGRKGPSARAARLALMFADAAFANCGAEHLGLEDDWDGSLATRRKWQWPQQRGGVHVWIEHLSQDTVDRKPSTKPACGPATHRTTEITGAVKAAGDNDCPAQRRSAEGAIDAYSSRSCAYSNNGKGAAEHLRRLDPDPPKYLASRALVPLPPHPLPPAVIHAELDNSGLYHPPGQIMAICPRPPHL